MFPFCFTLSQFKRVKESYSNIRRKSGWGEGITWHISGWLYWNSNVFNTRVCYINMPLSVTSKEALESMQYLAATIVLHTKLNIQRLVVLLVLGREPLSAFFDHQKISFFRGLSAPPGDRLCKIIFKETVQ